MIHKERYLHQYLDVSQSVRYALMAGITVGMLGYAHWFHRVREIPQ